jgi:HD superfamily phosphohydrolase YqeK
MNPNDLIDSIVDAIDYAELARDTMGLNRARRLLNNDLRQAIDQYVEQEVARAVQNAALPPESLFNPQEFSHASRR